MFRSEEFYDPCHCPQPGQKPGAMARGHRARAGMRFAADPDLRRHHAPDGAGFVRAAERERLGWRHFLDHHHHACWIATTPRPSSCRARIFPRRVWRPCSKWTRWPATSRDNKGKRVHVGGVDVDKILSPDERADKDRLVAALQHRLLQSALKGDQAQALARLSECAGQIERCRHPCGHPSGDVHAGISSDMKVIRHSSSCRFVIEFQKFIEDEKEDENDPKL